MNWVDGAFDESDVREDGLGRGAQFAVDPGAPQDLGTALALWVDLTGVEPRKWGSGGVFTWGQMSVQRLHEEIAESLELDRTETTGRMLMSLIARSTWGRRRSARTSC